MGGVQTVTKDLAEGICAWSGAHVDQAIEVTLITETPAGASMTYGLPFKVIRRPGFASLLANIWSADIVHLANPAFLPLVIAWLVRKPTVIEHHGYHAICPNGLLLYTPDNSACPGHFMARAYGKCVACCSETMGRVRGFRTVLLTFVRRWLCAHASANISISDHVAQRICLPRIQTIYHGVRDSGFDIPTKTLTAENCLQIGYVGRFVEEKGLPILLQAAKKLKEAGVSFRLTLIGDGNMREKLESKIDSLGIRDRVRFTGYLTGTALGLALEEIQVIVMTSQVEEAAGLAAMEHMMRAGLVVVADIGGLGEVVGEAGLKFIPGDPNSLFIRLREIAENPSTFEHLPMAARRRAADKFALPAMIKGHISLYQELQKGNFADRRKMPVSNRPLAARLVRALPGTHEMVVQTALRFVRDASSALDLGAGSGALAEHLQLAGLEVTSADISNYFELNSEFIQIDMNEPDFDRVISREYDLVTSVEVIEHLENPTAFLRSIHRLLKPNGIAILTTPNIENIPARLRFFLNGDVRAMDKNAPEHITPIHLDLFLRQIVPRTGFVLIEHKVYPEGDFPLTARNYLVPFFSLFKSVMKGTALTGDSHVFVLKKS